MKEANANIEDATGTTVSSPRPDLVSTARRCPRFLVNAFNTRIAPFATADAVEELAVAFLLKAVVREDQLGRMTDLFHSRFPGLVCTVTLGDTTPRRHLVPELTGMLRLFGPDQVGQLARIAEVLRSCRMTILNLYVTTGICDLETCEFVWREGGPLSDAHRKQGLCRLYSIHLEICIRCGIYSVYTAFEGLSASVILCLKP